MNQSINQNALKFGAWSALASFTIFIINFLSGYNPLGNSSLWGSWIPILFIVLAIRFYKRNQGYITFGEAFRTGFITLFSASLLYECIVYVSASTFAQNILDWHKAEALEAVEKSRPYFSEEFYQNSLKSIEDSNLTTILESDLLIKLLGGVIVVLIAAAIIRSKKVQNPVENSDEL